MNQCGVPVLENKSCSLPTLRCCYGQTAVRPEAGRKSNPNPEDLIRIRFSSSTTWISRKPTLSSYLLNFLPSYWQDLEMSESRLHTLPILSLTTPFRLIPLTSDHGDEPCPKALLPVANRPMIDFPLTWIEQSGITGMFSVFYLISKPNLTWSQRSYLFAQRHIAPVSPTTFTQIPLRRRIHLSMWMFRHMTNRQTNPSGLVQCSNISLAEYSEILFYSHVILSPQWTYP